MKVLLARFARDEAGATAIEYGLLAAGVGLTIIAAIKGLAGEFNATFGRVEGALSNAGK